MKLLTIFEILLLCLLFNLASCQLVRKNEAGQSVEQAEKDLMKKRAKAAKADKKAKKKAKKAFWKNQSKAARKSVRKNARSMKRM
ncbi:MAG: hypothetical protein ACEQR5_00385 [Moraxellaceae bacterium]|jgi:hypothetical protein